MSSSLLRTTTLGLSYRQRLGTPPKYSKAFRWHRMKVSTSAPCERTPCWVIFMSALTLGENTLLQVGVDGSNRLAEFADAEQKVAVVVPQQ